MKEYISIKDKILACYFNVYTNCIGKMVDTDQDYVYRVLKRCNLPVIRNNSKGIKDHYELINNLNVNYETIQK